MKLIINFIHHSENHLREKCPEIRTFHNRVKKLEKFPYQTIIPDFTLHNLSLRFQLILDNEENIHRLNKTYRKKDHPTDVLTFVYDNDVVTQKNKLPDAEIYICDSIAHKQAEENHHSLVDELTLLAVHGILHGLGMDHESSPQERERMNVAENEILAFLNLPKTISLLTKTSNL